jgi:hypothetical protein
MSKQEMRKRLAGLSFSEKVKILEKLRDRSLVLAASGLRRGDANKAVKGGVEQALSTSVDASPSPRKSREAR